MISIYKKLFDLLSRRERRNFLLLVGMILLMALFNTVGVAAVLPFLAVVTNPQIIHENTILSATYDFLGFDEDLSFLLFLSLALFLVIVFGLAFQAFTHYVQRRYGAMREYSISTRLLSRYLRQPYVWFLQKNSTELTKNILTEVHLVINAAMMPALGLVAHSTVAILILVLLLFVDPLVTAAGLLLIGGGYTLIFYSIRPLLSKLGEVRLRANTDRYRIVDEALGGIKEVQLLGIEGSYLARFAKPARRFASVETMVPVLKEIPRIALEAVAFGGILLFLIILLGRTQGSVLDAVPIIGLFAFAAIRILPAMAKVYGIFATLRFGVPVLNAVHRDFLEESEDVHSSQRGPAIPLRRSLELQHIRYSYPGAATPALDSLSFAVQANTTVGLVGSSGSGKTTTVDIILGLLVPDHGNIRVDGIPLTGQLLPDWQRSIGYVPQTIFLTDDTITANIALGIDPESIDHKAVKRAARLAELDHFVMTQLPQGYDTLVGQRGVRLSGGQRQRIGIARALYHDPSVLIFDEATSALDNITEAAVMSAIKGLTGLKTIVMVAHRLSTVADCDQIILLESGRVTAIGTFKELLNSNPLFKKMAAGAPHIPQ